MPDTGIMSSSSSNPVHHHHHHHNDNGNDDYNGNNGPDFYPSTTSSQYGRPPPPPVNHGTTPLSRTSHVLLHHSNNDQNNNSELEELQGQPPPIRGPPPSRPNPNRDLFEEIRNGGGHWSQLLRQVFLRLPPPPPPPPPQSQDLNSTSSIAKESRVEGDEDGDDGGPPPLDIDGGSENGQFAYVGEVTGEIDAWIDFGSLQSGDIILDVQGQQVAGYTQADVLSLLHHCLRSNPANHTTHLTVAPRGSLGPELRSYLNTRFQKGSVDHALQGVVRDNLYLRTVPVTTRPPRPGEINDVDYTFLSQEEFMELERNGSLLESGVYAGNHYGTPKPWANRAREMSNQSSMLAGGGVGGNSMSIVGSSLNNSDSMMMTSKGTILPGMHPSSEGKRRRNRSNVEALGAGDDANEDQPSNAGGGSGGPPTVPPITYSPRFQPPEDELGPLPSNWEMAYTEKGEVYFIDHNTGTSHWLDPRLSRVQKMSLEECDDNELPFGWERIDDPHYGTYYIDHVNRRTQFENPVLQAKQTTPTSSSSKVGLTDQQLLADGQQSQSRPPPGGNFPPRYSSANPPPPNPKPSNHNNRLSIPRGKTPDTTLENHTHSHSTLMSNHNPSSSAIPKFSGGLSGLKVKTMERSPNRFFTRDPTQLVGERIGTILVKSSRGLGFTIVGGDDDDGLDEFLQIKSVVPDGAAWRDAKLRTGDVLVRVNGRCVLGYTHQEMVSIFQSISPGEEVHLEVCRGYPLPFDPSDPNTEIVTTIAVEPFNPNGDKRLEWTTRAATPDSLAHSAHSLPELSGDRIMGGGGGGYGKAGRPASVDLLGERSSDKRFSPKHVGRPMENGTFLTVAINKGTAGFGFTIADSLNGQKVLDSTHCGGLDEGDRLIAIDGIDLRGLSHTQVVQILKDFPLGRDASLTVQRVHSQVFSKKFSPGNNDYSDSRVTLNSAGISPRSKTPTAGDLGRSRPRLRDSLPERSKTPVFVFDGHYNGDGGAAMYNGNGPLSPNSIHVQGHPAAHPMLSPGGMGNSNEGRVTPGEVGDLNHHAANIRDWIEMTIELQRRQEGFGFRIVGGTEEGSQVSVGHIVPRGAAAVDGRLQTNDQLIAVDSISVIGASHHSVVQLMARAASAHRVRLTVRRPIYAVNPVPPAMEMGTVTTPSHSPAAGFQTPLHVILKRQPSEGFGFVIISSASKAGATIGRIVDGSPADRCGHLNVGDRILAVNQTEISQLHHSQVVQLIKDSGLMLTLSVLPVQIDPNGGGMHHPQQQQQQQTSSQLSPINHNNMMTTDMENFTLKDNNLGYDMGTAFINPESQPVHFGSNHSGSSFPMDSNGVDQVFSVHLSRGNRGFGFSIRGGKEFQNMPLFVLRLAEDGPAAGDGRMQVGDQILQINGISTHGMTHSQAIHLIKTGGASVHLLLRRGSVPIPYLNQMPNFQGGGGGFINGHEEIQSVSSNNDQQFMGRSASPMFRDHHHHAYPSQM
ncbi:membrane-associated guanylate kinase, WW and PDZ domain-containing protein 3 isoform X2 [Folsomia candida]|uniref:membrane-associated guanylate kinase, WW and PDZ domain-containing protein 3 isoform X2 n=1 Tax=Folsomia candida TaxID=158441 RepID=UPI0016051E41|nr:membrane-associated guanylate kinase, WW and PDZ domain-containing protein 3 isoform X2 [Folsomia candida]